MAVLAIVAVWPLLRTMYFSLTNASLVDLRAYEFIGLGNYLSQVDEVWTGLFVDPLWWRALGNTLVFAGSSVALETVLGVGFALLLHVSFRGRGLMRAALLVPWAIPTVVSARLWEWMLNDQFGIVNDALLRLGVIAEPVAWLVDPWLALWVLVVVDVWKSTPFVALLVLAALQLLPQDCYDAAKVDGIPPWRVFFHVTLPLIRPALAVAVIFRFLDAMRMFDLAYVMTGTSDATMTVSVFARQQLVDFQDVGYGSAASTLLFVVIALLTLFYLMALRPGLESGRR
jgi:trehalose/maltose transport system permease protein